MSNSQNSQKINLFNKVQLMTYPDSLGGNLQELKATLNTYLSKSIGLVHILPPYPSSGDRGFAPLTHLQIEPKWGNWHDMQNISKNYGLMLDVITGHVATSSEFFQDYLENGENSKFYDMFARVEKTFTDGNVKIEELEKFGYLTPVLPLIIFKLQNGQHKIHFKTFLPIQADLDLDSPITREVLTEFIHNHAKMGVKMIRLDAIETICKDRNLGYHLVPHTFEIMQWLVDTIKATGMEVLCEVFGKDELKNRIVQMGAWIYDFNLPDVILHAILSQKSQHLKTWLSRNAQNTITVLTNHDGFMIGRIFQSLSQEEANWTRQTILENAGFFTRLGSGLTANNIAADGINATLFEALGRDQEKWLIANILHLFAPGVPQIYYNDLLCQTNDINSFKDTGEGRSLIRHNFDNLEIEQVFYSSPVKKMLSLMAFRNNFPAFQGLHTVCDSDENEFVMLWQNGEFEAKLILDLFHFQYTIEYKIPDKEVQIWSLESEFNW